MLLLPKLRSDQLEIAKHPAKIKVLAMGRRWGKTVVGGRLVMSVLAQHGRAAWIAPTYKNTRPMWRFALTTVAPAVQAGRMQINRSERIITTTGGGELALYSGDNIDSIRGEAFNLVVLDEAAKLPEGAWTDAIMPTLADFDGDALLISTPRGRNWFYHEYLNAQADGKHAAAWRAPTLANPIPNIQKAAMLAKMRVPEDSYRQEWLAEFVESGGVFRNVAAVSTLAVEPGEGGRQYVWGIDWAFSNDYTCVSVMDANTRRQVYLDRFNGVDYTLQRQRLIALAHDYPPTAVVSEANAMGRPNNEVLRAAGLPIQDFTTGAASKAVIIETLAGAIERADVQLLNDPAQVAELQAYEGQRQPGGGVKYGAPAGMHDDTVIALALAYHALGREAEIIENPFY